MATEPWTMQDAKNRLRRLDHLHQPSLVDLLLDLPQDDGDFGRIELELRPWES